MFINFFFSKTSMRYYRIFYFIWGEVRYRDPKLFYATRYDLKCEYWCHLWVLFPGEILSQSVPLSYQASRLKIPPYSQLLSPRHNLKWKMYAFLRQFQTWSDYIIQHVRFKPKVRFVTACNDFPGNFYNWKII